MPHDLVTELDSGNDLVVPVGIRQRNVDSRRLIMGREQDCNGTVVRLEIELINSYNLLTYSKKGPTL